MPQGQITPKIPLPEKVAEAVKLAYQKAAVMKEQELASAKSKKEIDAEVARLSITKDILDEELPKLQARHAKATEIAEGAEELQKEAVAKLTAIDAEILSKKKELKGVCEEIVTAVESRTQTKLDLNALLEEIKQHKEDMKEEREAFENRKQSLIDVIQNI